VIDGGFGAKWDLDHLANGTTRPSHSSCNRRAGALKGHQVDYRTDPRWQDDPERGVFWGPPSMLDGKPRRWSRPWSDWRSEREAATG
jgi:hypothetical protein